MDSPCGFVKSLDPIDGNGKAAPMAFAFPLTHWISPFNVILKDISRKRYVSRRKKSYFLLRAPHFEPSRKVRPPPRPQRRCGGGVRRSKTQRHGDGDRF